MQPLLYPQAVFAFVFLTNNSAHNYYDNNDDAILNTSASSFCFFWLFRGFYRHLHIVDASFLDILNTSTSLFCFFPLFRGFCRHLHTVDASFLDIPLLSVCFRDLQTLGYTFCSCTLQVIILKLQHLFLFLSVFPTFPWHQHSLQHPWLTYPHLQHWFPRSLDTDAKLQHCQHSNISRSITKVHFPLTWVLFALFVHDFHSSKTPAARYSIKIYFPRPPTHFILFLMIF